MQVDGTLIKVDGSWLSDPPIRLEIRHELVEFWMICGDRRHQHLPWLGLNARCRGPPAMIDGSANTATQTSYGSLPGFAHIAPWRYRTIIRIVVRWLAQPSLPFGSVCLLPTLPSHSSHIAGSMCDGTGRVQKVGNWCKWTAL